MLALNNRFCMPFPGTAEAAPADDDAPQWTQSASGIGSNTRGHRWGRRMVYDMFIYLWVHRWHPVQCAGRTAECWRWVECLPRSSLTFRGFFWSGGSPVRNNRKQVPLSKCTVKICCSIVLLHPIFMLAGWLLLLSLAFESFVSFMFMPFCFPFGYISTSAKPKPLLTIINHLFLELTAQMEGSEKKCMDINDI